MLEIENIRKRIESVISECDDIVKILSNEFEGIDNAPSAQIKQIEEMIQMSEKRGLPIPDDWKRLKSKAISHKEYYNSLIPLTNIFFKGMEDIISGDFVKKIKKGLKSGINKGSNNSNEGRPLGSKGNEQLMDYLIPVINFMHDNECNHTAAFKKVAQNLNVTYQTVNAQCTRQLNLNTEDFVLKVKSGKILDLLESKFPDRTHIIREKIKITR